MTTGELNRLEALSQLVAELDHIYPNGSFGSGTLRAERGMPDFVTTKNGYHREFGSAARLAVLALVNAWSNEVETSIWANSSTGQLMDRAVGQTNGTPLFPL